MDRDSRIAIKAASTHLNLIHWIVDNPNEPVQVQAVRDWMEAYADFILLGLSARIQSVLSYENDQPPDDSDGLNEPDAPSEPD